MKRYGHVNFFKPGDRGGAEDQKELTLMLREAGIIQITDERIEELYQKDKAIETGCVNHVVLHDRHEVKAFQRIMDCLPFKTETTYCITFTPGEKNFGSWLRKNKKKRKGQRQ